MDFITFRKQKDRTAWDASITMETLKWLQLADSEPGNKLHVFKWHGRMWLAAFDAYRVHAIRLDSKFNAPDHSLPLARLIHELNFDHLKGVTIHYDFDTPVTDCNWYNHNGELFDVRFTGLDRSGNEIRTFTLEPTSSSLIQKTISSLPAEIQLQLESSSFNANFIATALKGLTTAVFFGQSDKLLFVVPERVTKLWEQPWFVMTRAQQPTLDFETGEAA